MPKTSEVKIKSANQESKQSESQAPSLSAQDWVLKRYLELEAQMKPLTKELNKLKKDIKHRGSHTTKNYQCVIKESSVDEYIVNAHTRRSISISKKGE